eukprot:TRINITY_DN19506_c0_g1_i2.p1 TRINITY_DN19506_c0_g1~~TRINITY_DN19506_c0_g1_i2.p1  ORF type:complete len:214 (-),score=53.44 TRINITY_DN19506_c0_g1_i2:35-676(-)
MEPNVKVVKKELLVKDKYTSYHQYHYIDLLTKEEKVCEVIGREVSGDPKGSIIIPVCKSQKLGGAHVILIVSYRIPVESWVLEFPAGNNDSEDVVECAIRELKEETGYTGKVRGKEKFGVFTDPWKSNEDTAFVVIDVDLDSELNVKPIQNLEADENIQVIILPLKTLKKEILKLVEDKHLRVCWNIWLFAEGLEMGEAVSYTHLTLPTNREV